MDVSCRILLWVLLGWLTAEVWYFGDHFCHFHQAIISHLWLRTDGGIGSLCDVTFAPHSPSSYCPGWSGFERFWPPKLHTFSITQWLVLKGWCSTWSLRMIVSLLVAKKFQQSARRETCKLWCFMLARCCICIWLLPILIG